MTMQLQFSHQDYQKKAVDAVVQVFHGQPLAKGDFALTGHNASVRYAADGTIGNALQLSEDQLLANVQQVQRANLRNAQGEPDLSQVSTELLGDVVQELRNGETSPRLVPHLSLEMETGTGKTYTFIRTMYELNKQYGFKKFVVVVPSVAHRSCISRFRARRVTRSRAPNGSSSNNSTGSSTMARAIDTRWRIPPDSCRGTLSRKSDKPTISASDATRALSTCMPDRR
jgi:restriction endonuclease